MPEGTSVFTKVVLWPSLKRNMTPNLDVAALRTNVNNFDRNAPVSLEKRSDGSFRCSASLGLVRKRTSAPATWSPATPLEGAHVVRLLNILEGTRVQPEYMCARYLGPHAILELREAYFPRDKASGGVPTLPHV